MKQILRLLGGFFFLAATFTMPIITCYQKATDYRETEAVVTKVETRRSEGRRGRINIHNHLRYSYEVDGTRYDGYDPRYEPAGRSEAGETIHVIYNLNAPQNSRISEGGGDNWLQTLTFLGISGYLFLSFARNRRI